MTESNMPYQQILETIRQGGQGNDATVAMLRTVLGSAQLRPEEQMMLDFLLSLGDQTSDEDKQVIDGEFEDINDDDQKPDRGRNGRSRLERLNQEVADLREVNDTLAAALGACRYCWGGDETCAVCAGYGGAGWRTPNLRLFEELVVPAVYRVRALKQGPDRKPGRFGTTSLRR